MPVTFNMHSHSRESCALMLNDHEKTRTYLYAMIQTSGRRAGIGQRRSTHAYQRQHKNSQLHNRVLPLDRLHFHAQY